MLLVLVAVLSLSVLAGCATKNPPESNKTEEPDSVSSASLALDEADFEQKISKDGFFIIFTEKDLTFTKDLTVDGRFTTEDKDGNEVVQRSLAFVKVGAEGKMERFTVTVPRIVINSENTLLEYGIIKGDVYVQAPGFTTKEATIDGNLYFATQELMDAFTADDLTEITGEINVKEYTK